MVALILETLAVLLLAYIVICKKPIKIEFTINVNHHTDDNGQVPLPVSAKIDPFAEISKEEKDYYKESMNMISVINRVLSGENIEDIVPKKPEGRD